MTYGDIRRGYREYVDDKQINTSISVQCYPPHCDHMTDVTCRARRRCKISFVFDHFGRNIYIFIHHNGSKWKIVFTEHIMMFSKSHNIVPRVPALYRVRQFQFNNQLFARKLNRITDASFAMGRLARLKVRLRSLSTTWWPKNGAVLLVGLNFIKY